MEKKIDARKFQRLYFCAEDCVVGAASATEIDGEEIPITYLNLSEGGVCFQAERSLCRKLALEIEVVLKDSGLGLLTFLDEVHVRVKQVLDYDSVANISFGCEFINIPQEVLGEIRKLVTAGLKT